MARKPRDTKNSPTAPDDVSTTGTGTSRPDSVDGRTSDPGKEQDARLETYERKVERASVESFAEHPEGSAPPLERLVEAEEKKND